MKTKHARQIRAGIRNARMNAMWAIAQDLSRPMYRTAPSGLAGRAYWRIDNRLWPKGNLQFPPIPPLVGHQH